MSGYVAAEPLPEQAGQPAPEGLILRREGARAMSAPCPEAEIRLDGKGWGTVRALRFAPVNGGAGGQDEGPPRATVMHWHGGGFRLGSPEYAAPFAQSLADACNVEVICPEYRLAPEHPFPAGHNDGMAAIFGMLALMEAEQRPRPLILSGDSAGGGLAAGLALRCGRLGIPLAGLVLLSPWLDLTVSSPCYHANAGSDPLFSLEAARDGAGQYLQGHSARDPLASPLFAALTDEASVFPHSYVSVGKGEVLAGDSQAFHAGLAAAGQWHILSVIAGMEHVAVMRGRDLVGAARNFSEVTDFLREITGGGGGVRVRQ